MEKISEETHSIAPQDKYVLNKNGVLEKNGLLAECMIRPVSFLPGDMVGSYKAQSSICSLRCPHARLFTVINKKTKEEFKVYQTRCVAGWPQIELTESKESALLKK